jgi:hypothetical protein
MEKGKLYKVDARNFTYAVYDGDGGFIGIRQKFGDAYLFTELDYEIDEKYGTVTIEEDTGIKFDGEVTEDNDDLFEFLYDML